MSFMINDALALGTFDGANVEMRDEARPENFFLFGLTESEVEAVTAKGYRPGGLYRRVSAPPWAAPVPSWSVRTGH